MFDILHYLLLVYTEDHQNVDGTMWHVWCQNIKTLSHRGKEYAKHPIIDCLDMSKLDPYLTVSVDGLVPQLLYIFNKGVHRAAVVDKDDKPVAIVTQTTVLEFLNKHLDQFGNIATATIDDIGFCDRKVFTIQSTARAIHAYFQMMTHKVSGMAVVDASGVLIANLSISDLKVLVS
jgi:CBS domain-containing protein